MGPLLPARLTEEVWYLDVQVKTPNFERRLRLVLSPLPGGCDGAPHTGAQLRW